MNKYIYILFFSLLAIGGSVDAEEDSSKRRPVGYLSDEEVGASTSALKEEVDKTVPAKKDPNKDPNAGYVPGSIAEKMRRQFTDAGIEAKTSKQVSAPAVVERVVERQVVVERPVIVERQVIVEREVPVYVEQPRVVRHVAPAPQRPAFTIPPGAINAGLEVFKSSSRRGGSRTDLGGFINIVGGALSNPGYSGGGHGGNPGVDAAYQKGQARRNQEIQRSLEREAYDRGRNGW